MTEAQNPGVQKEAADRWPMGKDAAAINGVAEDGMSEVMEVDPDLVRASGQKFADHQRGPGVAVTEAEIGDCRAAVSGSRDTHFLAVDGVPGNGKIDPSSALGRTSRGDGQVDFADFACGKLSRQPAVTEVVPRDDKAAAGVAVEPVDDAWTFHASDG